MAARPLQELLVEVDAALRSGSIHDADRVLLERVHADLQAALAAPQAAAVPHTLRDHLREAIERFEARHPALTSVLSKTLDTLSDLGV